MTVRTADLTDVKVATLDRMNNSGNGNPKYRVTFTTMDGEYVGTYTTATDASVSYEIANREFRVGPVSGVAVQAWDDRGREGRAMTSLRIIGEPNHYATTTRDQHHFLGRCDECDAHYLRTRTLDEVDNWYRQGVIDQDEWEGFTYAWATSVPVEERWGLRERYAVEPVTERAREFAELVRGIAR